MNAIQFRTAAELANPSIHSITWARNVVTGEVAKSIGLKKDDAARFVLEISQKRADRTRAKSSAKINLLAKAEERLAARLERVLPLRVSQSNWAGGAYYTVNIARRKNGEWQIGASEWHNYGTPIAASSLKVQVWKDYSNNGKWSGNSTRHTLNLLPTDTFEVVGGLLTTSAKKDAGKSAKPCTWYEQARGFEVRELRGWLVDGYHIEASEKITTLEEAEMEVQRRADRAAKMENILTARGVMRAFHFCESGVRNFCEQNGIDFGKARLTRDELAAIVARNADHNRAYFGSYLSKVGITL